MDAKRIGVLGFSAGGHLSARLSTNYAQRAYKAIDAVDESSCKPDFAVLVYPAYLIHKEAATELPVTAETPPTFLTMAADDPVDADNVLKYSLELKRAKVPVELHLYPKGGHGYGLRRRRCHVLIGPTARPRVDACSGNGKVRKAKHVAANLSV